MANSLISVKNLSVKLNKKNILENINLEIYENTLTSILGSSGAGKTTLISTLVGLNKPTSGGFKYKSKSDQDNLGFVFQDALLYDEITVYKNIYLSIKNSYDWIIQNHIKNIETLIFNKKIKHLKFLKLFQSYKNFYKQRTKKWKMKMLIWKMFFCLIKLKNKKLLSFFLNCVNLKKQIKNQIYDLAKNLKINEILKNKASEISGGQRQRVAIAKALIKNSKIIFMDEPFSSLDADIRVQARDWLRETQKKYGLTVLIITHDQNDATSISDYIIFLSNKTIKQYDKPENIFNKPYDLEVAKFIGYPKINFLKSENGMQYYLRPKNLKINKVEKSNYIVTNIINNGNFNIFQITNTKTKNKLSGFFDGDLKINDYVEIKYYKKDVIKFNRYGINLIYEK